MIENTLLEHHLLVSSDNIKEGKMRKGIKLILFASCIFFGSSFAGQVDSIYAAQSAIKGKVKGHCELTNVTLSQDVYAGECAIKEIITKQAIVYDIVLGSTGSHKFASDDGGKTWYTDGQKKVEFKDYGHSATFRWSTFLLAVKDS